MSKLVCLFVVAFFAMAYAAPQPQLILSDGLVSPYGLTTLGGVSPIGLTTLGGVSPIGYSTLGGVPISTLDSGVILLKK
ncbi:unnamed protein product [Orchesella dallaii]|uniref:Uncharacterized protein n=1 Tax=Orchesella dallaii TaxID=48710 RepID=A0ABP1PK72_9HEXA